jgi:hypothetical protein
MLTEDFNQRRALYYSTRLTRTSIKGFKARGIEVHTQFNHYQAEINYAT